MTIKPAVRIADRKLVVKERTILTGVPENVVATSGAAEGPVEGVFLGVVFDQDSSRHVVPLGTLRDVRFLACFRFKLWWMAQKMGDKGRDVPLETQFLLVETKEGSHLESDINGDEENNIVYTVFLPLIEGPFKACLQGNDGDQLELCLESGDSDTVGSAFSHSIIVNIAKEKHGLKYVYVWHAITGYWGGVRPGVKEMEEYESAMQYPKLCKGVMENEPGWKTDAIAVEGLGLVNPKNVYKFYNELHSYLTSAGVDGVKVDAQCILETLGAGLGGRVELTKQYHQALDASIARNFPDNGCIACMSHNLESLYCSKQTAIVRASDDFYPRDPASHTIHIAAVAYNSVFIGEIMLPDWDMFHSLHPAAEYHGSARAISGGAVYVSDAPGKHNFDLLKKLVLPDGSVLRAQLPGRPTKDCIFSDPARDGVSLLKIWNMNKYTGVLGVYNCQGAAWNSVERKNTFHKTNSEAITGYIRGRDVHLISDVAFDSNWDGNVALYSYTSGVLKTLPYNVAIPVSLKVLEHEIFTITPVKILAPGFSFAPLGLIDMFNSGGAIEGLKYDLKVVEDLGSEAVAVVSMAVKGCGRFGSYSSTRPRKCTVGSSVVDFEYDSASGLVTLDLDEMPLEHQKVHNIEIEL
ncbi:hypothetical protein DH2020_010751 [Rehmannia glutinosa]|uniref:Galactinol--sucrose galactosyltransferase n=1 Tax=Rehmannia glutinosa TaxID=99300 RepID=A0ABR0XBH3_REHGL